MITCQPRTPRRRELNFSLPLVPVHLPRNMSRSYPDLLQQLALADCEVSLTEHSFIGAIRRRAGISRLGRCPDLHRVTSVLDTAARGILPARCDAVRLRLANTRQLWKDGAYIFDLMLFEKVEHPFRRGVATVATATFSSPNISNGRAVVFS